MEVGPVWHSYRQSASSRKWQDWLQQHAISRFMGIAID